MIIITVENRSQIECLVATLSLGLCAALESKSLSINEANSYLYAPFTLSLLKQVEASSELLKLVHLGSELEDYRGSLAHRLPDKLTEMKNLATAILRSQPALLEHEHKEHWLQYVPPPDADDKNTLEESRDVLVDFPADKTISRGEKIYRMLMVAYNEVGEPFWSFVQELFSINYWNNTISDSEADVLYQATIPEAQELMRELMRRGLAYVTRRYGFPPPSSSPFVVAEGEAEYIIADPQNWVGPLVKGPSAVYYKFCTTVPSKTITRDTVRLLFESVEQPLTKQDPATS